jgi:hypothetical protein
MNAAQLKRLPGAEIVVKGLEDLALGTESPEAAAVQMASTRLRHAGLAVPPTAARDRPAAHRLYELLAADHGAAAHSRYNAVVRRLVSFARALENARSR